MNAYDFINEASPIPYVKDFLSRREADRLAEVIQATIIPVRERNKRNSTTLIRMLRYGTYVTNPEARTKAVYGTRLDIKDAPEELQSLRVKLCEHTGKDINYMSVLGYADQHDHINPHQHREDRVEKDQSVYVVSLLHVRELVTHPVGCKDRNLYEYLMPEHGSLYTLPSEYNTTHEHSIPDCKYPCGLRISINCKHESVPGPKPPYVRRPGPPRIYDQHKGKEYPAEAVNVDRNTIFGNHSRHDRETGEGRAAWRAEVAEKMKDASFAAEVEKLRGKDLLCWCSPAQVKAGHCHAQTWLTLAAAVGRCKHPGCKNQAPRPRPEYGIGNNGFCFELHGGSETGDDTHPAQIARGIPKTSPEERLAYEKRLAQMRLDEDNAGSSRPSALLASRNSGISWTHDTLNFWLGCDKVSEECQHCYILRFLRKLGLKAWGEVVKAKTTWGKAVKWENELKGGNQYMRMFTCSLSDFFHKKADPWRDDAWKIIKSTPHVVYLILTKRPERILKHLPADWGEGYSNVWLGTSIGSNKQVHRADVLRKVPAAVRFLSCEPLLEDIADKLDISGINWVIAGGESGDGEEYLYDPKKRWQDAPERGRRTMDLGWASKLHTKANDAGVPFFFKQITSARSGVGADALTGKEIHEFPAPPNGGIWWAPPAELVQIKGESK